MRHRLTSALLALSLATGCSEDLSEQRPPGQPGDFVRAADILVTAQCELDKAAARDPARFRFRTAEVVDFTGRVVPSAAAPVPGGVSLTMTLTVQRTEAIGGGITLTIPIASTDLTLRRERTPTGAALRKMDFRLSHRIGSAPDCPTEEQPKTASGARYIAGGLGLVEWIAEADTLVTKSGQVPSEVNYQLTFEVALSKDLSPIFSRPIDDVDGTLSSRGAEAAQSFLDRIGE